MEILNPLPLSSGQILVYGHSSRRQSKPLESLLSLSSMFSCISSHILFGFHRNCSKAVRNSIPGPLKRVRATRRSSLSKLHHLIFAKFPTDLHLFQELAIYETPCLFTPSQSPTIGLLSNWDQQTWPYVPLLLWSEHRWSPEPRNITN